jgi:magnesium-transporting ATPase (P-type)
LDNKEKERVVR